MPIAREVESMNLSSMFLLLSGAVASHPLAVHAATAGDVPAGHVEMTLSVDARTRHALVYWPKAVDGKTRLPLVIMLHGMGGMASNAVRETGWSAKAEKEGFAVVYPDATRPDGRQPPSLRTNAPAWNDGSGRFHAAQQQVDDVAFIDALIDRLVASQRIDPKKIFIAGFSNGASMTFLAGARLSNKVAAIAPVSGSWWDATQPPVRAVSLFYLTGSSDTLNPLAGGFPRLAFGGKEQGGQSKPPVRDMVAAWAKALQCPSSSTVEPRAGVHVQRYFPCRDAAEVRLTVVDDLGHVWAGGKTLVPEFIVGKATDKLVATDDIWTFFRAHPMP
jgi:polyhydroxybutyrate depolymerase